jgi:hypothetical protein
MDMHMHPIPPAAAGPGLVNIYRLVLPIPNDIDDADTTYTEAVAYAEQWVRAHGAHPLINPDVTLLTADLPPGIDTAALPVPWRAWRISCPTLALN